MLYPIGLRAIVDLRTFDYDGDGVDERQARECASASLATASARSLLAAALCARASGRSIVQIRRDYVARCRELARHATPMGAFREGYDDGVSLIAVCRADMQSNAVAMPRAVEAALE